MGLAKAELIVYLNSLFNQSIKNPINLMKNKPHSPSDGGSSNVKVQLLLLKSAIKAYPKQATKVLILVGFAVYGAIQLVLSIIKLFN